jgi:hypothetical protein
MTIAHITFDDDTTDTWFTDEWYARHPSYQRLSPQTESHARFVVENHYQEKGIKIKSIEI